MPLTALYSGALRQRQAEHMRGPMREVAVAPPQVPLVANVTARAVESPENIRRLLVDQVTGLVRWRESVLQMKEDGVHRLIELGAGKVLTGLARRIDRELAAVAAGDPAEIEAVLKLL